MPICKTCHKDKPETEFHTTGKNKTLKKECKECINEKRRLKRKQDPETAKALDRARYLKDREKRLLTSNNYRNKNSEKIKKRKQEYRAKNKEQLAIKHKNYYKENKAALLEKQKLYYQQHKTEIANYKKQYNKTEKGRCSIKNGRHAYRSRKLSTCDCTITAKTLAELMVLQQYCCFYCNTPLDLKDRNTHLDHYMPLSKGGAHSISNVVWSCAACNLTKNNKLPIKDSNDTSI